MTLVCVPLVAKTVEQMVAEMAAARARGADLVEIRLDHLAVFHPRRDLQLLLKNRPIPALVTYRPKWEGGEYEGDDCRRFNALCLAMELGAEYIDIELKVAGDFARFISGKRPETFKLIVSSHNYQSTPSRDVLGSLVARIQAVGADIVKIATTALDIVDVTHMFQIIVHCQIYYGHAEALLRCNFLLLGKHKAQYEANPPPILGKHKTIKDFSHES